MNLNTLTIAEASRGLRHREFSAAELTTDCLRAIQEKDKELHAYLEVFDDAREAAKKADEMFADAKYRSMGFADLLPLLGIPLAIKDNILMAGKRASAGSRMLENYRALYDATVIKKLKNQGAVFLGRTNMDEFAMGSSTEHSAFGPTLNPHDARRVPGGSSGGSAAAVAAHCACASLGSDTGGSIRQPAAFCGIVGMKPSYGMVSRNGLIAMASSLDQIGPLARSVEDVELLFDAIAGHDPLDATSLRSRDAMIGDGDISRLRVGVPREYFGEGIDADVAEGVRAAIHQAEKAGAHIEEISLPHARYALSAYYIIVSSEVSSNLARYDGIRYGFHAQPTRDEKLLDAYEKTRAVGFGKETVRRIMLGTYALSAGYYDAYYLKAQSVRDLLRHDFDAAFSRVDVIAGPTTPTPAFLAGERAQNPLAMYLADIYTVAVNLAGLPAISLPAGSVERDGVKLPIGLQLIANHYQDRALLSYAQLFEELTA